MPPKKRTKQSASSEILSTPSSPNSVHSVCDSNDFEDCLLNYFEMSEKKIWEAWEENLFVDTYIDWQKTKKWDPQRTTLANFGAMANFMRQDYGIIVTGPQCQSKYYRMVEKWRLFTHLRGDSSKPETGIGWDAQHKCFSASPEQWGNLYQMNKQYLDFQYPNSADLFIKWDEVMDGKTATGSRAQSSGQPPPQFVPPRARRRRGESTGTGKGVASSLVIDPPNHLFSSDDDGSPVPRNPGKRPMSSNAYSSEKEGSRGTKSQRSGSENYQEALSNFNKFSCIASNEREAKAKYAIDMAKAVVEGLKLETRLHMFLLKELLDEEFRALFLSFSESEQRTWIEMFIIPKMEGK